MPAKPNARNWNDIQTAIATTAIVATLSMWNLFATPAKAEEIESVATEEKPPALPLTEPPLDSSMDEKAAAMPKVKIIFTQVAPQTTTNVQQPQQQTKKKKKKNKNNDDNGGGGGGGAVSVTQTQSS